MYKTHKCTNLIFSVLPFVDFHFEYLSRPLFTNYKSYQFETTYSDRTYSGEEQFTRTITVPPLYFEFPFKSSPEHNMLEVSFCDRLMSCILHVSCVIPHHHFPCGHLRDDIFCLIDMKFH